METKNIKVKLRNAEIHGLLYLPTPSNRKPPVVIRLNGFPGYSPEVERSRFASSLVEQGIAMFAFDYPGVRDSTGIFDYYAGQESINEIVTAVASSNFIDPARIGLLGESFGGAMAICHAARDPRIQALYLRSPVFDTSFIAKLAVFDDLHRIWTRNGQMRFPQGTNDELKQLFTRQTRHYNPLELSRKLDLPVRMAYGVKDELLPEAGYKKLLSQIPGFDKKQHLLRVTAADHNFTNEQAFTELRNDVVSFFVNQFNQQLTVPVASKLEAK